MEQPCYDLRWSNRLEQDQWQIAKSPPVARSCVFSLSLSLWCYLDALGKRRRLAVPALFTFSHLSQLGTLDQPKARIECGSSGSSASSSQHLALSSLRLSIPLSQVYNIPHFGTPYFTPATFPCKYVLGVRANVQQKGKTVSNWPVSCPTQLPWADQFHFRCAGCSGSC